MTSPARRAHGPTARALRAAQSRRLQDVASTAGVSVPFLSKLERGRETASETVTARLADALTVPVEVLTGQRPALGPLRDALGIDIHQLGRELGIGVERIAALENGVGAARPELLDAIARRLGVDVDALGIATSAAVA